MNYGLNKRHRPKMKYAIDVGTFPCPGGVPVVQHAVLELSLGFQPAHEELQRLVALEMNTLTQVRATVKQHRLVTDHMWHWMAEAESETKAARTVAITRCYSEDDHRELQRTMQAMDMLQHLRTTVHQEDKALRSAKWWQLIGAITLAALSAAALTVGFVGV